jgi:hypothetical protein
MGGGAGVDAPRSSLDVMRDQARRRCGSCGAGTALRLDLRQPEPWRHPDGLSDVACPAGPLYDRMLVFLQAPAARCRRCAGREIVVDSDAGWVHLDGTTAIRCERAAALARLTERTVTL